MNLMQFAAARSVRLMDFENEIRPIVIDALSNYGAPGWYEEIVTGASVLWLEIFEGIWDGDSQFALERFQNELRDSLAKTSEPSDPPSTAQVERVLRWLGVFSVNNATYYAAAPSGGIEKTWIDMDDAAVRPTHRAAAGQTVPVGGTFDVGGFDLRFPGEPVGPPDIWINCRCLLAITGRPEMGSKTESFAADTEERVMEDEEMLDGEMPEDDIEEETNEVPWHGVLAVEGVPTGDKRQFDAGALEFAPTPMPVSYQRMSDEGHKQSVIIGRIDEMWREDSGEIRARGAFNTNIPEANEVIDGIVFGSHGGVSIDIDNPEVELDMDEDADEMATLFGGGVKLTRFVGGRIRSASVVGIPAFQEAYIALGLDFEEDLRDPEAGVDVTDGEVDVDTDIDEEGMALIASAMVTFAAAAPEAAQTEARRGLDWVAEGKGGDGLEAATLGRARKIASGATLTDEHIKRMNSYFARHEVDKKGKGWSPDEEGYPSAGRVAWALWGGDAGKSFAESQVSQMEEASAIVLSHLPNMFDEAAAHLITAGNNLRDVLENSITASASFAPGTKDGPGWLTNPRETARLRRYWTKGKGALKIRWGAPGDFNRCRKQLGKYVNPAFLAGTCANLHKVALGIWPGQHRGNLQGERSPAFALVASAAEIMVEAFYFQRPEFTGPTPITVDGDHIFGHLAAWGTCHIGIGEKCVMPPSSPSDYSYFLRGVVDTTAGPVRTGPLVMWTGHAGTMASAAAATKHYDDTGKAVADIAVGEDTFGIWFSGRVRDSATTEDIVALKASAVSGDWRDVTRRGTPNEMVGLIACNVPGFSVPRVAFGLDGERQVSLIASGGMLLPRKETSPKAPGTFSLTADDLAMIGRAAADELEYREERRQRLSSVRDPELLTAAQKRRAERLAAAKTR